MPGGYFNQARMTINSSGGTTSPLALNAAVLPFSTFATAGVADQTIVPYSINDTSVNVAEKGWGLYASAGSSTGGPSITRNAFTNGGTLVVLSSQAQVFIDPSVADLVQLSLVAHNSLGGV